jgi:hypothetical protein
MLIKFCFVLFFMLTTLTKAAADCNAAIPKTTPDEVFILYDDGTVIHQTTGLMWMRCMLGQTWDGANCSGSAQSYDWQNALQAVTGYAFAGYNDWRLPNKNELASIMEEACSVPTINTLAFPNASTPHVWSSSSSAADSKSAWAASFNSGRVGYGVKATAGGHVRLVRGGQ